MSCLLWWLIRPWTNANAKGYYWPYGMIAGFKHNSWTIALFFFRSSTSIFYGRQSHSSREHPHSSGASSPSGSFFFYDPALIKCQWRKVFLWINSLCWIMSNAFEMGYTLIHSPWKMYILRVYISHIGGLERQNSFHSMQFLWSDNVRDLQVCYGLAFM